MRNRTCSLAAVLALATKCDEESGGESDLEAAAAAEVVVLNGGLVPEAADACDVGGRRDHRGGVDVTDGGVNWV